MTEIVDNDEFNIEAIAVHLRKGPFASIFEQSNEKDDHVALKLMCIVDYNVKRWGLYKHMQDTNPRLLAQLMQFQSYGKFKFYDYQVGHEIGKRVLQCKFCDLIGPYGYIFTHMAINHNDHSPLKTCAYCNRIDLKKHFGDDSLHPCFANYLRTNAIEWNENVCNIVTNFYDMLKELANKFKIITIRTFAGRRSDSKDISGCLVALDEEFKHAISYLYGGNDASRLLQQSSNSMPNGFGDDDDTIVISDSDGDYAEGGSDSRATNRTLSSNASVSSCPVIVICNNRTQRTSVSSNTVAMKK